MSRRLAVALLLLAAPLAAVETRMPVASAQLSGVFDPALVTPGWQGALQSLSTWAGMSKDPAGANWARLQFYVDSRTTNPDKLATVAPLVSALTEACASEAEKDWVMERIAGISRLDPKARADLLNILAGASRRGGALAAASIQETLQRVEAAAAAEGASKHENAVGINRSKALAAHLKRVMDSGLYPEQAASFAAGMKRASGLAEAIARHIVDATPSVDGPEPAPVMVYESPEMAGLDRLMRKFGPAPATVLIEGESGTGKELVARGLHRYGGSRGQFHAINLAAIPETLMMSTLFGHKKGSFTGATKDEPGAIVKAAGGTLFLDEIGELPQAVQAGLLRFLQEGELQPIGRQAEKMADPPRLIAATNRDLAQEVAAGRFRRDLYYRLNILPLRTQPLRERPQDVLPLARHFLKKHQAGPLTKELSPEAEQALTAYLWPGNVRELENAVQRALILSEGPLVGASDLLLPGGTAVVATAGPTPAIENLYTRRNDYLRWVLKTYGPELALSEIADQLGISGRTLYRLMKKLGLDLGEFRADDQAGK